MKKFKQGIQYIDIVSAVGLEELTIANEVSENYQDLSSIKFIKYQVYTC